MIVILKKTENWAIALQSISVHQSFGWTLRKTELEGTLSEMIPELFSTKQYGRQPFRWGYKWTVSWVFKIFERKSGALPMDENNTMKPRAFGKPRVSENAFLQWRHDDEDANWLKKNEFVKSYIPHIRASVFFSISVIMTGSQENSAYTSRVSIAKQNMPLRQKAS